MKPDPVMAETDSDGRGISYVLVSFGRSLRLDAVFLSATQDPDALVPRLVRIIQSDVYPILVSGEEIRCSNSSHDLPRDTNCGVCLSDPHSSHFVLTLSASRKIHQKADHTFSLSPSHITRTSCSSSLSLLVTSNDSLMTYRTLTRALYGCFEQKVLRNSPAKTCQRCVDVRVICVASCSLQGHFMWYEIMHKVSSDVAWG